MYVVEHFLRRLLRTLHKLEAAHFGTEQRCHPRQCLHWETSADMERVTELGDDVDY